MNNGVGPVGPGFHWEEASAAVGAGFKPALPLVSRVRDCHDDRRWHMNQGRLETVAEMTMAGCRGTAPMNRGAPTLGGGI